MRLMILLATALLLAPMAVTAQTKGSLKTESAWARASLTPRRPVTAYVSIHNAGSDVERLVAMRTEVLKTHSGHGSRE